MRKNKQKQLVVKKERLVSISVDIKFIIKLIFASLVLTAIWYIIYFQHLIIYLHDSSKYSHYLFTILVSVLTLMITVCIGIFFGNLGRTYKIIVILIVFYFAYLGYTYIGIGIEFRTHFGLLNYNKFETNSYRGIRFFISNIVLLFIAYIISFTFENEKK